MNRRNYLQTLSALFAVSAFGGCTSAGKQKDASNSETDIAGPALAGEAFDVPAVSEESKIFIWSATWDGTVITNKRRLPS